MYAASLPQPHLNHAFPVDSTTYNDASLAKASSDETPMKTMHIYAAMKSESEKAMFAWMKEKKPGFVMNSIVRTYLLPHFTH
jgi:hypothetical protein